jgi:mono/diheme cytochrome c family protein
MAHGTGRRNHRPGILWFFSHLKMGTPMATGKYLLMAFRGQRKKQRLGVQIIAPAVLHRVQTVLCMLLMTQKVPSTVLSTTKNKSKMNKCILIVVLSFVCMQSMGQVKAHTKTRRKVGSTALAVNGKDIYVKHCLACHQADGGGVPNMNPPLSNTSYVSGDKTRLIKVVLNGFSENVDIDGESYSNVMPAHDFLKDREIAAVLTYIRKNFTNKASAISATQVKAVRAANKSK